LPLGPSAVETKRFSYLDSALQLRVVMDHGARRGVDLGIGRTAQLSRWHVWTQSLAVSLSFALFVGIGLAILYWYTPWPYLQSHVSMTESEKRRLRSAHTNAEEGGLLCNENSSSGGADQDSELEIAQQSLKLQPNAKAKSKQRRDGYDGLQRYQEREPTVDNLTMARSSNGDECEDARSESGNGSIDNDIIKFHLYRHLKVSSSRLPLFRS
jgi:hypothetical protein